MAKNAAKSVYLSDAERIKDKLDTIGPGMCLAKWQQVSINLTAGLTHSCYHPRPHAIPLDELEANPSALHNTSFKKLQRKTMLEGGRPPECQYCWNIEDAPGNHMSDRHYRSGEPWAATGGVEVKGKGTMATFLWGGGGSLSGGSPLTDLASSAAGLSGLAA